MESCLGAMDLLAQRIDPKVKIIYILLNEFFIEHHSLQQREKDNLLLSMIDAEINRNVAQFNTFLKLLTRQVNFIPQSIHYIKPAYQPAFSKEGQNENSKYLQSLKGKSKFFKRKFILRDKHRGPYRSYTRDEKNHVVFLHSNGMNFATISKQLGIPQKNVVRWCREGIMEGDSNKRLADSDMEKTLWLWLEAHPRRQSLNYNEIQAKALKISSNPHFKASRGWLKNFLRRCDPSNEKLAELDIE